MDHERCSSRADVKRVKTGMKKNRLLPCMALYCIGVMCSNPGGGTSQYFFTLIFFFSRCGERLPMETERSTMTVFENIKDLNFSNFYLRLCLRSLLSA